MKSRTNTVTAPNGAKIEVATVDFGGRSFTATGSIVDDAAGFIVGYPGLSLGAVKHELRTWDGEVIAKLTVTGQARGFNGSKLTCWAMTYNGHRYHGRNGGLGMVLRMRRAV